MMKAKVGDTIQFKFSDNHIQKDIRGKVFEAKVAEVNEETKKYGVWADYGDGHEGVPDYVPFDEATIIDTPRLAAHRVKRKRL